MNKYEVGYEDEIIGVFYADTEEEAIRECRSMMENYEFTPDTPVRGRLKGMIAIEVDY